MTLLTPLNLLLAAGVVVPVLIHLFGRPRPRLQRFSSLMLLREAMQRQRARRRLRDIIALILRCLAIITLAVCIARPIARGGVLSRIGPPAGEVALIVDTSASMGATQDGRTLLDRARVLAASITDVFGPDRLRVAVAGARLRPLPPGGDLLSALPRRPSPERGRLTDCIARLIAEEAGKLATVYVLTDLQESSLPELQAAAPADAPEIVLVDVGALPAANLAITRTELRPPQPVRGAPVTITANVRAWGAPPEKPLPIRLTVDEQPGHSVALSVGGDASARAEFSTALPHAGVGVAQVSLPGDAMAFDDRRTVAALVRERLQVLVVGEPAQTRFIAAALDPWPAEDSRSTIAVDRAAVLRDATEYDALIIASAGPDAVDAGELASAVQAGTGALLFAGPEADAQWLTEELLPAVGMGGIVVGTSVDRDPPARLVELEFGRAPLAEFARPGAGDLQTARFPTVRELSADGAAVLARFDDGRPALLEAALGRGTVLLAATSPGDRWTDLPRRPVFVPLMHRMVYHLAAGRAPTLLGANAGELLVGELPRNANEVRVESKTDVLTHDIRGEAWNVLATSAGVFRVVADGEVAAAGAVNISPAESLVARLDPGEAARRLAPLRVEVVGAMGLAQRLASPLATDLSTLFAFIALLLIAAEAVQSLAGGQRTERADR